MIYRLFENTIRRDNSDIAMFIKSCSYSYASLYKAVGQVRYIIRQWALPRGSRVAIEVDHDFYVYATILALWYEGMVYVPIEKIFPDSRKKAILQQADINHIVLFDECKDIYDQLNIIQIDDKLKTSKTIEHSQGVECDPQQELYILFTSGSTGRPKGVIISHSNLYSFIKGILGVQKGLSSTDRFLQYYNLGFDASIHCFALPLHIGASFYTVDRTPKYIHALKTIKDHRVTVVKLPPSVISLMAPYLSKMKLPNVCQSLFGGEAVYKKTLSIWAAAAINSTNFNVYGPTEATINCTAFQVSSKTKSKREMVSIGKPFGENKSKILPLPTIKDQKKGELLIGGPQVCLAYTDHQNDKFITIDNRVYYKTGDLVEVDDGGDMFYIQRIDDQFQWNGYRIEPTEIEAVAAEILPGRNVFARKFQIANRDNLGLFVEGHQTISTEESNAILQSLPDYMHPSVFINIPVFQRNMNGKISIQKTIEKYINES